MIFVAILPADRKQIGRFGLLPAAPLAGAPPDALRWEWGPVPCLAKADQVGAAAHGNPTRDPTQPYGDHPLGTYAITGWAPTGTLAEEIARFGPHGKLVLDPLAGDALLGKSHGRYGLLLHAGVTGHGGPYPRGFRPTYGCLRLLNADMAVAVGLWRRYRAVGPEATITRYVAVPVP